MNEKASAEIYKLLSNPCHWQGKAGKLKYSADLLFSRFLDACDLSDEEQSETLDSDINDIATLLYGLAMENILKSALIKSGKVEIKSDGEIHWKGIEGAKGHDLLAILKSLRNIELDTEQAKLMERLSAFVSWAGKYPMPLQRKHDKKDFKGFHLLDQPGAAKVMTPLPFDRNDKVVFDDIYKMIENAA